VVALQKSLMEQSDIVPLLEDMNFQPMTGTETAEETTLVVENPPVVSLEGVEPPFTIEETEGEE